jgi:hypothetical protein
VVKSRTGIRSSLATMCNFNQHTGEYDKDYSVYTLLWDKPHKELKGHELPKWANRPPSPQLEIPVSEVLPVGERRKEGVIHAPGVRDAGEPCDRPLCPADIQWEE